MGKKKTYEKSNQIKFLTFLKTITISNSMRIFFLSLGFISLFVFFVFKLQLGIFLEWKRMCASLTVSKSKFTTYWAENYQGQAAVSFKGSHVALSFRKPLSLIANIFLLKYKPLNKILKKL